jgi:hypothetical protein
MAGRDLRGVRRLGVVGTVALVFCGSAVAYVCHPDPPGTRTLAVAGRVDGYALSGNRVSIDAWIKGCERQIVWRPLAASRKESGCTVGPPPASPPRRSATDGHFRAILVSGSQLLDQPDRLDVYEAHTGRGLHEWPLPAPTSSVQVARGVAVLSTSNGVYVLRLRDGRFAMVGVKRPGDRPEIARSGLVFQDDQFKRRSDSRSLLKFMPFATVRHALRPLGPLRVPFRIGDFSLDGRSVIFVKKDPTGKCDRIGLWLVPWHYSTNLMDEPPICPERHAPGGVTALALGGQYLEVVTTYGNVQTLVSSTFVRCIEKVVTRTRLSAARISALAAEGDTLAYAVSTKSGAARLTRLHGQTIAGSSAVPSALRVSVDSDRLAVLRAGGRIDILWDEQVVRTIAAPGARAVALRHDELVVLTRRKLDIYALSDGRLLHSWAVAPATAPAVDVHYGFALLAVGKRVVAVRLATGERRVLVVAPARVRAQLDDIGAVYVYNSGGGGVLGFIPFAAVEHAFGS